MRTLSGFAIVSALLSAVVSTSISGQVEAAPQTQHFNSGTFGGSAPVTPYSSDAGRGRPDPTFGGGRGWVATRIPGVTLVAYAAIVLRGGAIVVAGQEDDSSGHGQIIVARYRRSGRLDQSFGSGGIFKTALPPMEGPFIATSIGRQSSTGKLVVGGGYGLNSMLVLRLTPSGRLDPTFGRNRTGIATVAVGGIAGSLVVQRNGGILVGGSNANQNGRPMVVARFTRNGELDRRFGRGGIAQVLFWNPDIAASAGVGGLATTPGGGVIGLGHLDYIGSDGHGSAGVFRLSSRGQLVHGFGSGGHLEVAFKKAGSTFAQWFPCAMTVDSRHRITVTGDGSTGAGAAILSARLVPRGTLDPSFGKARNGRVVTPGLGGDNNTTCGAASSAAGALTAGVGSTVAQLQPDGAPNDHIGHRGLIKISHPPNVTLNGVRRPDWRRVVLAGSAGNGIYVARYLLPTRRIHITGRGGENQ